MLFFLSSDLFPSSEKKKMKSHFNLKSSDFFFSRISEIKIGILCLSEKKVFSVDFKITILTISAKLTLISNFSE